MAVNVDSGCYNREKRFSPSSTRFNKNGKPANRCGDTRRAKITLVTGYLYGLHLAARSFRARLYDRRERCYPFSPVRDIASVGAANTIACYREPLSSRRRNKLSASPASRSLLQTRFKGARTTCEMHRDLCSFDVLIFFVYLPATLR